MSWPREDARRFVVDANVFVAAVKPFSKPAKEMRKDLKTLNLLIKLIADERLELVGNSRLVAEYGGLTIRWATMAGRLECKGRAQRHY